MTIARQRLAKYVPDRYAVNKNRRPLLDNGFGEHAFPRQRFVKHVGYCEICVPVTRDTQITTDCWIECSVFGSREAIKEGQTTDWSTDRRS
jgi:hypothetical protein